jgi:hypothetical protein
MGRMDLETNLFTRGEPDPISYLEKCASSADVDDVTLDWREVSFGEGNLERSLGSHMLPLLPESSSALLTNCSCGFDFRGKEQVRDQ